MFRCLNPQATRPGRGRTICCGFGLMLLFVVTATGFAQKDPGIRGGPAGAGQPFDTGLTAGDLSFFNTVGLSQFTQVETVDDGLGPRFNLDSCAGCHAYPAVGGSSPPTNNPQVLRATVMAPRNRVPPFLTIDGPIREVRFIKNPDGTPDGGVHDLFTITGRSDSPGGCAISQPDFSNLGNIIFRIPTPLYGAGLIESIPDATLKKNLLSDPTGLKSLYGIKGHLNTNGNDGTVTRFGWKAQNKSLLIFAGEAYNVEMGITNENFPNEREEDPKCAANPLAENHTGFDDGNSPADIVAFMGFMRFLDQPKPSCGGVQSPCGSVVNGRRLFNLVGCATCHTPSLTTGFSPIAALNQQQANMFSDLALHHMGAGLADGISQGSAGPDEFRTAPLWGLGQRAFFLHDGRTSDLLQAIVSHFGSGSEANLSILTFASLLPSQLQDILNFLRSL